jgi:hypothetical protein
MSDEFDSLDAIEKAAVEAALFRCRALAAKIANELRNKRAEHFVDRLSLADIHASLEVALTAAKPSPRHQVTQKFCFVCSSLEIPGSEGSHDPRGVAFPPGAAAERETGETAHVSQIELGWHRLCGGMLADDPAGSLSTTFANNIGGDGKRRSPELLA